MAKDDPVTEVMAAFSQFKELNGKQLAELREDVDNVNKVLNRPFASRKVSEGASPAPERRETWVDTKSRTVVPVLNKSDRLSDERAADEPDVSLGRFLRGIVLGGRAHDHRELEAERKAMSIGVDPSGGYTVSGALSREWIDLLRAKMVLQQAGCRTIPMETGELTLARVTGDPTVQWHGEGKALEDSNATLGAVRLHAKTVTCLVKASLELMQDSANIETILSNVMTTAVAQAIDSAGLNGVTTDAAAAPGGIFDLTGRNSVTSIGAPTSWDWAVDGMYELMLDNVPTDRIGALVGHPAIWKKMRKLKTGLSGDNTPLTMPAEVAALPKLWTTAAPLSGSTASAVIGDWRDLLMGVRRDISVKVLSERYLADTLEVGILVYARVDFAATRPASFCTLEGIAVS
jgi:HK97 family phage major capsid protein